MRTPQVHTIKPYGNPCGKVLWGGGELTAMKTGQISSERRQNVWPVEFFGDSSSRMAPFCFHPYACAVPAYFRVSPFDFWRFSLRMQKRRKARVEKYSLFYLAKGLRSIHFFGVFVWCNTMHFYVHKLHLSGWSMFAFKKNKNKNHFVDFINCV